MALTTGARLGSYEIQAHVGSGGMGDVYRARDGRLGRIVALKVLRDSLNADPEAFDRFAREAQLLASLHHPHIATVFALEESDGVRAIVQEFVDGPTLSQRLSKGALSLHEALTIARQIADGLDAAHQRGIIHRDLKPANVKLTADGVVKLLDFGLAKALAIDVSDDQVSREITIAVTQARTVLGTPAYMSPEQAAGAVVDRRTDIWAFGCVLFEMLAGRPPFDGETVSSVLAATMHDEPPWSAIPASVPPSVQRVLRRCLRKDPKRRLRDIGDVFVEVDDEALSPGVPARAARSNRWVPAWIAAGAVAGGLAVWSLSPPPTPTASPRTHASIALDNFVSTLPVSGHLFDVSPDGRHLAYVATQEKPTRIWVRALDDFLARPLPGSERASNPFFSPDGLWVGFFADEQVKKVALAGGSPIPILDFKGAVRGARWARDGTIVIGGAKLLRIPASGVAEVLAESEDPHVEFRWPELLPNGRAVLATRVTNATDFDIVAVSSPGVAASTVLKSASNPIVVGDFLLYAPQLSRDSNSRFRGLFGVRFSAERLEAVGTPFPAIDDVQVRTGGAAEISVAESGVMVSMPALQRHTRIVWADRQGTMTPLLEVPGEYWTPRLSPDGRTVSLTVPGPKPGLFLHDRARGTLERVTTKGEDYFSIWSPDGRMLASCSDGLGAIAWRSLQPGGGAQQVATGQHLHLTNWSPDGRFIIFETEVGPGQWEVRSLDVESRKIATLVRAGTSAYDGVASPDGRWLAYTSDHTGRLEVYVVPFGTDGRAVQISTEGGRNPEWSREGSELFFVAADGLFTARVQPGPAFRTDTPRLLFRGQFQGEFDVARGARQFLMAHVEDERNARVALRLVLNWQEELRRRAAGLTDGGSPR